MSKITIVGGKIIETTGGDYNIYAKENIVFTSAKTITETSEVGIIYGDYVAPPEKKHPEIVELQFIDDKDTVLKQSSIKDFGEIRATDFFYGKKMKIKITTRDVKDGTKINLKLKAESKSLNQEFIGLEKLNWNLEIKDNSCETDFFELNPLWYSEDLENYNYDTHKTEIKQENLNSFYIRGFLGAAFFNLPQEEERLRPVASYLRNYEELVGMFHTDNSGKKDLIENYENKFIALNEEIAAIAANFSAFLHIPENRTIAQIKARVEQDAKSLWDAATKQVQAGHLDDRPLYWARNKMQVRLKRYFLFEKDIDFEKSIVKKGTELDKIIQLFEEKSRNYTGIDFSKAGGKKKVLITGFDPFVLNEFDHPNTPGKSNRQNPSGISVLNFHGKSIGNAYIQSVVIPVRYEDFDNEIIEKIVEKHITIFDFMLTTSKNDKNFDLERFASKFRGGFLDNMNIGYGDSSYNSKRFKQIQNGNDFYETTLPIAKILTGDIAPANLPTKVYFDQSYKDDLGNTVQHPSDNNNTPIKSKIKIIGKSTEDSGSGGDYLSNEVMYRSTKKRDELGFNKIKAVGHIHISSKLSSDEFISILTKIIENATK
ncbi:hypothetical protein QWY99_15700 [Flavobacterium branchiarum]|uniref:Uncharacterized protein n=1 Tax=Flavobacterium branchiarum TaxID=1114870 RepID=A0ABV5FLM1_9FLAO|nr:hypothetical protein [Flavobacterium branchiarum]MDN3674485.1 hypothetical protein [Flavobacterium branchiarum]